MVEIQKWKQVYMTTNVPVDAGGNYYYPALVPANATIQLPVTDIAPDPALGDRGLKFDWATNTWNTSEDDPTNKKIAELQQIIKGLTTSQLNMIADQTNTDSQEPAPAQGSQATQATQPQSVQPSEPSSEQPTQPTQPTQPAQGSQATQPVGSQSGVSSLSDMAGMLNNPDMAKEGDK
jgi:hypothetical protein